MAMQGLVRRGLAAALQSGASRGLAAGQQRAMSGAASYGEEVGKQRRAARAIAIPRRHRSNSDAEPPAHAFRVSARTAARLTLHTHARSSSSPSSSSSVAAQMKRWKLITFVTLPIVPGLYLYLMSKGHHHPTEQPVRTRAIRRSPPRTGCASQRRSID